MIDTPTKISLKYLCLGFGMLGAFTALFAALKWVWSPGSFVGAFLTVMLIAGVNEAYNKGKNERSQ